MTPAWDLACFSYLAHAQVLQVERYPQADHGTEVDSRWVSLAADGPITALTASALGLRTALVANGVGHDPAGETVRHQLAAARVHHAAPDQGAAARTPNMTVITDRAGTRTWFADLTHAYASLHRADTRPLAHARLAYVDCYQVLADDAATAIKSAATARVPLLLNLGNDPLHPAIEHAARGAALYAVQTGLPEQHHDRADATALELMERLNPYAVVITLGARGAWARTRTECHRVPTRQITVANTHGAGAAFSAGLAAAYLDGCDLPTSLHRACAIGTDHCTSTTLLGSTPFPAPRIPVPPIKERTAP
ncbi:carbohydrate kinase family protein [Streptomyces cinnamoneus]|uniref:carbohydrate kinase family protein n=1 Tax=Streptomyces cinnamoneus TaxID=53446 RepID=UPI0033CCA827